MSSYSRKAKRKDVKTKAPRCCGQHMFMNKYGLYQCRKCGRQKFNIGAAPEVEPEVVNVNKMTTNDVQPETNVTESNIIDVEAEVVGGDSEE